MIKLNINGKVHEFSGDPTTPVLWYLRDELDLTGPKYGCGMAQCGACTVHINGVATRSCVLPVSAVGDSKITTIEGLSENGDHPVQKAWVENKVPQCGFCQCGQIMQAASMLAQNPNPSDEEIVQQMSGNICRCGTYPRIFKAIKAASSSLAGVQYYTPEKGDIDTVNDKESEA